MFEIAEQSAEELALIEQVLTEAWEFKKAKQPKVEMPNPLAAWLLNNEEEPLPTERFDVEGAPAPFYIRRLDVSDFSRVMMYASRNSKGQLVLTKEGHLRTLMAAVFYVALATNESGLVELFESYEQAHAVARARNERTMAANTALFAAILQINEGLLPKDAEVSEEVLDDFLAQVPTPLH